MHETSTSGAPEVLDEHHPLWQTERNELYSVGIDIGTTTTHLLFSRLEFRRAGQNLSSRLLLTRRHVLHRSDIILTPYTKGRSISTAEIDSFLSRSYQRAGFSPDSIDTGAVIITGEATRKRNARAITRLFSRQAGKFVCACAGHHLEAAFAAHGSGAVAFSLKTGNTVLNIDVGGGTSKYAVVKNGVIIETCAINIGARLVVFNAAGQVTGTEKAGRLLAASCGFKIRAGLKPDASEKQAMADLMARCLLEVVLHRELSPLAAELLLTPALKYTGNIDTIMFSGGVSGYLYDSEAGEFGDLGKQLGRAIRWQVEKAGRGGLIRLPLETIRATVIGASQFAVQLSGNTIYVSDTAMLPLRNLRVVPYVWDVNEANTQPSDILARLEEIREDRTCCGEPAALSISWSGEPSRRRLLALAKSLASWAASGGSRLPLVAVLDRDIARALGKIVKEELRIQNKVAIIDGIELREFDYIDIGKKLPGTGAVPVVIKSLVFYK